MVRNWEIIRAILLRLEASETPNTQIRPKDISDFPEQEVVYNMRLLGEAEFIKSEIMEFLSGDIDVIAFCLTNSGHDLLDTMRSEPVWSKIKETFTSKGIEMTFDLVVSAGKKIAENFLLLS